MTSEQLRANALVSVLLQEDASFYELVQEFVDSLPARVQELNAACERRDLTTLRTLAHRLKGAGGSFGYPQISALAAQMETAYKADQTDQTTKWLEELNTLAEAAKNGLASFTSRAN
ncbi:MAG: Hpt domain-containing protein [Phycisphaerales bacterium]|nr:Hpt domain-containing protein [Phycisphaerales bacterium]